MNAFPNNQWQKCCS